MKYKKNKHINPSDGLVINVINQIITMFPEFENKKETIINKLTNNEIIEEINHSELIFDKIILDNIVYYKDKNNYLWNTDANIIGIYTDEKKYFLFSDINKINDDIQQNKIQFESINKSK